PSTPESPAAYPLAWLSAFRRTRRTTAECRRTRRAARCSFRGSQHERPERRQGGHDRLLKSVEGRWLGLEGGRAIVIAAAPLEVIRAKQHLVRRRLRDADAIVVSRHRRQVEDD